MAVVHARGVVMSEQSTAPGIIDAIPSSCIEAIARDLFGSDARVTAVDEIRPTMEHGIARISGCNANLSYIVAVGGHPRRYVFRFSRGYRDCLFDKEASRYETVAERTGIPVPHIWTIDHSRRLAPTDYMVMAYMRGDHAFFLTHPRNPTTGAEEKREIQRQTGHYYAQVHDIERPAEDPDTLRTRLLYRLEQLQHVVADGQLRVDQAEIQRCRDVVAGDGHLEQKSQSLCVGDAELHFSREAGSWQVAFICDMEWVDYGEPYLDLVALYLAPTYLYELDHPIVLPSGEALRSRPSLDGYERLRPIDYDRLGHLALYGQLDAMCSIVGHIYRPDKRNYLMSKEPLYVELVDAVSRLAC